MIRSIRNISNKLLLFSCEIPLKAGINLIGGGNGVGKTTLVHELCLWARATGRLRDYNRLTTLFSTEESLREDSAKLLGVEVKAEGPTGRLLFWQNHKDNHRYVKPDFFRQDNTRTVVRYYSAGERSEGENVVESLLVWLEESAITGKDVVVLDEIDSGLSVDACNGVIKVLLSLAKKTGCQIIVTCNSFHFPFVCGGLINLLDGSYVEFGKSYEEFCKFSLANAKKLVPIREKARRKACREQEAEGRRREARRKKEMESRMKLYANRAKRRAHSTASLEK